MPAFKCHARRSDSFLKPLVDVSDLLVSPPCLNGVVTPPAVQSILGKVVPRCLRVKADVLSGPQQRE